jgi:anti-sigma-K factor RskA/putative zinc finger protein
MTTHEEFLELCAAATAGELDPDEQTKLDAHLANCAECCQAMREYEIASRHGAAALASELAPEKAEMDSSWSVEKAEEAFFTRLDKEAGRQSGPADEVRGISANRGQRFTYRPSQIRWREVWTPFAAAVLLALALGIAAYRTGIKRGTDVARSTPDLPKGTVSALEEQLSDAGHERAQLMAKLTEENKVVAELTRQLSEQQKEVNSLKAAATVERPALNGQQSNKSSAEAAARRGEDLLAAETKLEQLQKTVDMLTGQREELTSHAATLQDKVGELTELVRDRERERDEKQEEVAKQQELLEHDRDIRELMGARDLYVAEVHDVSTTGQTNKTYGRVFFTKGKRLVFYAYDLDAQPGLKNASTFQAWGRRGPDKQQVLSLGIFFEDNIGKKRWVLKTNDPKTLDDIDAVFVTVEPDGGSRHPSGKQLLFAYLRVNPNHP